MQRLTETTIEAKNAASQASSDFKSAKTEFRGALTTAGIITFVVCWPSFSSHTLGAIQIVLLVALVAACELFRRRLNRSERNVWLANARSSIVDALAEQKAEEPEIVIDLRDDTTSTATPKSTNAN